MEEVSNTLSMSSGDSQLVMDGGEDSTNERRRRMLKNLPSRQLSLWKQRARERIRERDRTRGKDYEAVNNEDLDEENSDLDDDKITTKKGKYEQTEPLSERVKKLRDRRNSSLTSKSHGLSCFTAMRLHIAMKFNRGFSEAKEFLNSYELWRGHFKEIEGSFGNGVLSYFTFLKWLLLLNVYIFIPILCFVIIPQALSTGEELPLESPPNVSITRIINASSSSQFVTEVPTTAHQRQRRYILPNNTDAGDDDKHCNLVKPLNYSHYTNKPFELLLSDFISGVGWINTTLMFYGSYSDKVLVIGGERTLYNMPLAYFMVGCTCFLVILLSILWSASQIFEESYVKEGSKYFHTYSNKVFGGWDMCIEEESAGKLQSMRLIKEIEADLEEDFRLVNLAKRTRKQVYKLYTIRVLVNLIVVGLSVLSAYLIFIATQMSIKTSLDVIDVNASSTTDLIQFLKSYASPIALSTLGFIVPTLFFFLSRLEDWNPRVRVNVDLARTVLLKLASVAVLLVSLYNRINKTCMLCWENVIAAEMYKLIWTDFFVTVFVIIAVETPRRYFADHVTLGKKIGRPEFFLPDNVLQLVYGQSLIWIGTWYSPFLPLMALVKLPIIFYAKKATVLYNCRSTEKAYRAGRSNYFFMILLLGTFLLCLAAVAYGITQIRPSELYGPFRGLNEVYDIVPWTVSILPSGLRSTFQVISSPVFLVVLGVVICLGLYFFYAIAKVYRRMIFGLREELSMESRDKKYLLQMFSSQQTEDQS